MGGKQQGGEAGERYSKELREGSVSRREKLVIRPSSRPTYTSQQLFLPVTLAKIYLFPYLTIIPSVGKVGRRRRPSLLRRSKAVPWSSIRAPLTAPWCTSRAALDQRQPAVPPQPLERPASGAGQSAQEPGWLALGEQRLSWRQGSSPQQCTQEDSGEGSGRRSRSCDGGGPGLRYCWQGKGPQSPGRPHEALPYGTEALFRVLGRHSAHQGGDAGSVTGPTETRLRIPARARALEVIPRGRVGSCFPRTKPLLWSPQTEAPCPPDGVASGCDASPGRL